MTSWCETYFWVKSRYGILLERCSGIKQYFLRKNWFNIEKSLLGASTESTVLRWVQLLGATHSHICIYPVEHYIIVKFKKPDVTAASLFGGCNNFPIWNPPALPRMLQLWYSDTTLFTCHVWQSASEVLLEKTSHETGDVAVVLGVVGVLVALVLRMP